MLQIVDDNVEVVYNYGYVRERYYIEYTGDNNSI